MAVYETEYGNFGTPQDILIFMKSSGFDVIHITTKICGEVVGQKNFEMSIHDVEKWIEMGRG